MLLGEKRAKAVASYLVNNGVPAAQLTTVSYGESKPRVQNCSKKGLSKNRRVEIKY